MPAPSPSRTMRVSCSASPSYQTWTPKRFAGCSRKEVYLLQPDLVVRLPVVAVWTVGRPHALPKRFEALSSDPPQVDFPVYRRVGSDAVKTFVGVGAPPPPGAGVVDRIAALGLVPIVDIRSEEHT